MLMGSRSFRTTSAALTSPMNVSVRAWIDHIGRALLGQRVRRLDTSAPRHGVHPRARVAGNEGGCVQNYTCILYSTSV